MATSTKKSELHKILGLSFGLAITVGGTIGVSIFRLPGAVAGLLDAPWLIVLVWLLGGVYTLLSANYTAELATMLPKAGGPYVYAYRAYGPFIGFAVGWTGWLGDVAALSFLSIALGEYCSTLQTLPFSISPKVFALSFLVIIAVLNGIGLRSGSFLQQLTSFLKAAALFLFAAFCFIKGKPIAADAPAAAAPQSVAALFAALSFSFQLILGAYGGWNTAVYFSEEDKNPDKNIPRSLHLGVLLVLFIYLLVNLAILYVLPVQQMAQSPLPAARALETILGKSSGQVLTVIAVISILGIINATVMFVPRILFALGRDGLFTQQAAVVNKGGTPVTALVISVGVAIVLLLWGTFETLLAVYAFYAVFNNILLIGSLFVLRKRQPHLHRPFRTWAYPLAPALLLLVSVLLFVAYVMNDTRNSLYAMATVALSYPVYLMVRKKKNATGHPTHTPDC